MADNDNSAQLLDNPPSRPIAWQRYLALCKPKVVLLIVFTALVGMLLAMPGIVRSSTAYFSRSSG